MRRLILLVVYLLVGCVLEVERVSLADEPMEEDDEGDSTSSSGESTSTGVGSSSTTAYIDEENSSGESSSSGEEDSSNTSEGTSEDGESSSSSGFESTETGGGVSSDTSSASESESGGAIACYQFAPCEASEDCCPSEPEDVSMCYNGQCIVYAAGPLALACDHDNLAEQCPGTATCFYFVHDLGAPGYCCMPPNEVCNQDSDCCFGSCVDGACVGDP